MSAVVRPTGPLHGIRVVDFTANMAGPYATQVLGDQGAEVTKVEPPRGDVSRSLGNGADGYSAFFANLNRSKRSVTLDLTHPQVDLVLQPLLDRADVVVHSFRPGPAHKLGLEPDQVRSRRPALIHATITGFGSVGPYAGRPAYDHVIQALAGFAAAQADPRTGEPGLVRQGVVDKLVGQTAAQAITAALFERTRTGVGRALEVRMLDAALAFLWPDAMMNHTVIDPAVRRPDVSRSFRLTRTSDGYLAFVLVTNAQSERLATALGLGDVERPIRPEDQARLFKATAEHLSHRTTAEGVELLASVEIPAAPVLDLDTLHQHPQTRAADIVAHFDHPVLGPVRQPNPAVRFDDTGSPADTAAPRLGEHNDQIAGELGLDPEAVQQLRASGLFGRQAPGDRDDRATADGSTR